MAEWLKQSFPNVVQRWPELITSLLQTLNMVSVSALFSAAFGILFGVLLVVTAPDGIRPNRLINQVLDKTINIFRSIPFVIMIALLLPITRLVAGTSYGTKGAIFPLIVGTVPFFSRQIHAALCEVDSGMVEAAQSMGASPLAIVWRVYLREGLKGIVRGAAITIVNLIALSAMAGTVGGGGLGDFAKRYGFDRSMGDITLVTVVILLLLVTLIQSLGNVITRRLNH